jgi:DNA-binding transcriptional MerR regulator
MNIKELCERWGCTDRQIDKLVKKNVLHPEQVNVRSKREFPLDEVEAIEDFYHVTTDYTTLEELAEELDKSYGQVYYAFTKHPVTVCPLFNPIRIPKESVEELKKVLTKQL